MRKGRYKPITPEQKAELQVLAALPDEEIDTRDMPEIVDWSGARRGVLYRPVKQQITLRIDADVIEWFRSHAARTKVIKPASIGLCGNILSSISGRG